MFYNKPSATLQITSAYGTPEYEAAQKKWDKEWSIYNAKLIGTYSAGGILILAILYKFMKK